MLDKVIRILNFDNSVIRQKQLLLQYPAKIIDLTGLAAGARLYASGSLRNKISRLIPAEQNYPTFIGSGDFHHISEILTSRITQPASLVVFDFHPDWDGLPPRFGCGSWVAQALENNHISKCILVGMGSHDLGGLALQTAALNVLSGGRLEIYPYRHKPSRVYLKPVPENCSLRTQNNLFSTKITWSQLENTDLMQFTLELIKRLPTRKVYISIDKDCLKNDFALTNWEEGFLNLGQLLAMLKLLRENLEIIGLDVTGDYSVCPSGKMKAIISKLDHPRGVAASRLPEESILLVNEKTNLAILKELFA
jgi:hypothetical protein